MESVRPPRPMDVKKLMAKRRLACVSLGKMPSYHSWQVLSLMRSFSLTRPRVLDSSYTHKEQAETLVREQAFIVSTLGTGELHPMLILPQLPEGAARSSASPSPLPRTWKRYLIKMREDDVVSSSVSRMHCSTDQGSPSVDSKCANSDATLRSLLVSSRWMIMYCFIKQSAKLSCGRGEAGEAAGGGRR